MICVKEAIDKHDAAASAAQQVRAALTLLEKIANDPRCKRDRPRKRAREVTALHPDRDHIASKVGIQIDHGL